MKQKRITTYEAKQLLSTFYKVNQFEYFDKFSDEKLLTSYLLRKIDEQKLLLSDIGRKTSFSREIFEQILLGELKPNRDQLIQIAIVLKLSIIGTQVILKIMKEKSLYKQDLRDRAIAYSLQNQFSLSKTQYYLKKHSIHFING